MMQLARSWIDSANDAASDFPLNNLPYGVFSTTGTPPRCGVAIGDFVVDVADLETRGVLQADPAAVFRDPSWNAFMALGREAWSDFRDRLTRLLAEGSDARPHVAPSLVAMNDVSLHMPFQVSEYTDFYAGRHHATNVGTMFRGAENALPPNWLHIPIGYNGRASSVVVSGTDVRRPWGQLKPQGADAPVFAPCQRFDMELEIGAIVGVPSNGPVDVQAADDMIFGYLLLNDWSARDIQAWEYQPLGPFQAKATATTISPWIVTAKALEAFRVPTPKRDVPLLPYLREAGPMLYDIALEVGLTPQGSAETVIARTNYREMYYSSAQQLAHHTSSGCPMRVGDLLGSGTISGPEKGNRGSLLEMSWGGKDPIELPTGERRCFLDDGDRLTLRGAATGNGFRVGFGECTGVILPALAEA